MEIRAPHVSEITSVKELVDKFEEMDTIPETFSIEYYKRILSKGILLIAEEGGEVIGVCFGNYNVKEGWADLLGLVVETTYRKQGVGSSLAEKFEKICKEKKLKTIDLYADKDQTQLFRKRGFTEGRTYTAFRKKL